MINGAALRINSKPPPPQNSFQHNSIQIPMLGSLGGPNKPPPGQQQQQQQQQPQAPQQQQGPQASEVQQIPQNGQDYTLSNVLHYLQTEWRRYERDRNEWEIERAEMRARIALLEGERRSFDNVKLDLMRRIKMLEYALRVERSKQLAQPTSQSVPPAKLAALQSQIALSSQKDDASSGSSPRSEDSPLPPDRMSTGSVPNGAASASGGPPSRTQTWVGQTAWSGVNPNAATVGTMGRPLQGRDPKSRARSRDFLKQCLQEVSYLTSPQAMNPLPNRPLLATNTMPPQIPNVPSFEQLGYNGRLKKTMPEVAKDFSTMNGMPSGPSNASAAGGPQTNPFDRSSMSGSNMFVQPPQAQGAQASSQPGPQQVQHMMQQGQPIQQSYQGESREREEPEPPLSEEAVDWKERFRLSQEASEQTRHQLNNNISGADAWERRTREEDDGKAEEEEEEEDDSSVMSEGESTKVWKAKRTLRNHLDAVRAIAFHPTELCLASAGDDNTVKIWRVDLATLTSPSTRATTEVEPQLTLRGHSAAITCLVHSPSKGLLYSASLDSSIRIWALPPPYHTTYAPYDASRARGELIGHTDAVWDLALARDESTLISCGAEGLVKVWDVSGPSGGGSLKLSWSYEGLERSDLSPEGDLPGASAVEAIRSDLKKVAVAYQNAVIKIFEIESGKELLKFQVDPVEGDDSISAQANAMVSHPTMPLLITGHEDKHIRIFDINTGQCTHSMVAHLDAVTSLSLDAAGFLLVSGSHDCSVRYWEILGSKACKQENTSHREKAREGVLDVEFHPSLPVMASAGADGVVKLYATTSAS
ncbi:WD40 repeat-like protein [Trametes coccinea BRFM310]|uniref:WD40 repeat-like protein n=1 Tax=Trametes coccinea (strain BRFM310) TaxID=1353009 RepID=A0A1Y2INX6_TRAC3|nr:WD40 repeat-like protein [Trametes coccinea BRFM310]